MNWLTAKVAQGLAAALLVLCIGLGVQVFVQSKRLDVAAASLKTAQADKKTTETERDSWKAKTGDALAANSAYGVIFDKLQAEADAQQLQAEADARTAAAAVAAARRDEAAAEKTLADFRKRSASKPAPCAAALLAMQSACPTLEHY